MIVSGIGVLEAYLRACRAEEANCFKEAKFYDRCLKGCLLALTAACFAAIWLTISAILS